MSDWSDIGAELRSKREASGQSLQDVFHQIRIPVAILAQIEDNDYSQFPSAAYTKGFLAQYSEYLDLDATDWLDHFEAGDAFENLDSIGYLQDSNESLDLRKDRIGPKPAKASAPKKEPLPAPVAATSAPDVLQHLMVLTMTGLFFALGIYGFIRISDRIEQSSVDVADPPAGPATAPILAPVPNVVPSRPAPPKRPKILNSPAPAVAEVVSEGPNEVAQPVLAIDAPPRAIIIDE